MAGNANVSFTPSPPPKPVQSPARKLPNRSIPVVSLMGIFPAPLRVKTPTDIATHKAGQVGVLAVRQDGSGKGRRPAQIAGPRHDAIVLLRRSLGVMRRSWGGAGISRGLRVSR